MNGTKHSTHIVDRMCRYLRQPPVCVSHEMHEMKLPIGLLTLFPQPNPLGLVPPTSLGHRTGALAKDCATKR